MESNDQDDGGVDQSVAELHESGMSWPRIAETLGVDVDEAMARYREEAYDHWNTGWELGEIDGRSHVQTGAVNFWEEGDALVLIEELNEEIPLTVLVDSERARSTANVHLDADEARELATVLEECADILEGEI